MPPVNKMQLPAGMQIPGSLQEKLQRLQQPQPFQTVPANQYGPSTRLIGEGSLVNFNYLFWKHDPYPLVIVTRIYKFYISGINLHYLTFPYIKNILQGNCDNRGFSYNNIKGDQYIVNAFRTYKRSGIKRLKTLDCAFILNVLASVRTIDPQEVEKLRQLVQEQLRRRAQPKAEEMTARYMDIMKGQPGFTGVHPPPVTPPE
jgi:hypothetical protein